MHMEACWGACCLPAGQPVRLHCRSLQPALGHCRQDSRQQQELWDAAGAAWHQRQAGVAADSGSVAGRDGAAWRVSWARRRQIPRLAAALSSSPA